MDKIIMDKYEEVYRYDFSKFIWVSIKWEI